jgi:hypothetical protein
MADDLGDHGRALLHDAFTGVTKAARDLGIGERLVRAAIERGDLPVGAMFPTGRASTSSTTMRRFSTSDWQAATEAAICGSAARIIRQGKW